MSTTGTGQSVARARPGEHAPEGTAEQTREHPEEVGPKDAADVPADAIRPPFRRPKLLAPLAVALLLALAAVVQLARPQPATDIEIDADAVAFTFPGRSALPWPQQGQAAVAVPGTGTVGVHGPQRPAPIASVAKVMTAYVLLGKHPLTGDDPGPTIEVDAKAVAEGRAKDESRIEGLSVGQRFSQRDLLKMLMIPSGNNIARLLARWSTKSDTEAAFVREMNDAAKRLGMADTRYTDPSGLDAGTVSTAVDQLKLAEAVMAYDVFRATVALPSATVDGLAEPLINNMGDLLLADGLSIRGVKTGSNTPAGGTLMWAAYKTVGDRTPLILGTVLDQRAPAPDPDGANSLTLVKENSRRLVAAVRAALVSAKPVRRGQVVGHVDDGFGGRVPVVVSDDLTAVGVPGQRVDVRFTPTAAAPPESAKAGTEVGTVTIGSGADAVRARVTLKDDLEGPSIPTQLTRLN
ncbi:D-alanyl-D-alanine carboxypeptidase [Streptomyces sp. NPDC047315]|uniref:D-alanyl-D-alanine carboxypeptidase family protein n=1 Tax=Streptomyces sp. NPDC047315 TaxID=3155142 RepID=UPI00340E8C2B